MVKVNRHWHTVHKPLYQSLTLRYVGGVIVVEAKAHRLGHLTRDGRLGVGNDVCLIVAACRQNFGPGVGLAAPSASIPKDALDVGRICVGTITSATGTNAEPVVANIFGRIDDYFITLTLNLVSETFFDSSQRDCIFVGGAHKRDAVRDETARICNET